MFSKVKAAALSALIALGGIAAVPATAQADGFFFGVGPSGGVHVGVHSGPRRHYGSMPRRHYGRPYARICTPRAAVAKAASMGVRHARVRSVNYHVIRVRGHDWRGPVLMRFARAPGCPLV
ncbi:MAG: hypothetical protein K5872_17595 [Rhizobiaceae bacterium]|nr:hypothetical protein [Rhizobiaceae bacterium]MCV0408040.1 hypothetical protein [Rhizobiaceae bacterium]